MIGGLAREFFDNQVEPRKFLARKALLEDGSECAAFFRKERQIALRAAYVSRENHLFPLYSGIDFLSQLLQLRVAPLPAVTFEQKIGFPRPPATGCILWHRGRLSCAPDVEDGVHDRPSRFNAVAAIE